MPLSLDELRALREADTAAKQAAIDGRQPKPETVPYVSEAPDRTAMQDAQDESLLQTLAEQSAAIASRQPADPPKYVAEPVDHAAIAKLNRQRAK